MTAAVKVIPTIYATMHTCQGCDVCGNLGCLDDHGLCGVVNPEQTEGCFREPLHEGLHTFELHRAVTHKPTDPGKS